MSERAILLVDNDLNIEKMLKKKFGSAGYLIDREFDGKTALKKIEDEIYDLVVADLQVAKINGLKFLKTIKELKADLPVIAITATGSVNDAVKAMQLGASDYVLKPFSIDIISYSIKNAFKFNNKEPINNKNSNRTRNIKKKLIIAQDPISLKLLEFTRKIAPSTANVLISGPTGTGKELLAIYVHEHSGRSRHAFVGMNCAALPEHLAESELYGHEKGAFTGAFQRKIGKFELADNGTILLDEISEMSLSLQAKLLRVIQEKEIDRVGGTNVIPINTRIIATTNLDLNQAVKAGRFREDLFYRLNVINLKILPLKKRKADIIPLATCFLEQYCRKNNKQSMHISDDAAKLLLNYNWPGNVRELENTIERAVIISESNMIRPEYINLENQRADSPKKRSHLTGITIKSMEKNLILDTLHEVNENRTHAAKRLGISIRTLRNKLSEYKEKNDL